MATAAPITVTPVLVAELFTGQEERMPLRVHLVDHPDGRVLVDTGFTAVHPAIEDFDPILMPLDQQDLDLGSVELVVNTHLHFDHCGGNHLFPGRPVHVQRVELEDARTLPDYTIPEWVDAPGVEYVALDGERELLPGVRIVPTPGHTRGSQVVVVETDDGRVVIAGDTAITSADLDEPTTEGQRIVLALDPSEVWLAHQRAPWRPPAGVERPSRRTS